MGILGLAKDKSMIGSNIVVPLPVWGDLNEARTNELKKKMDVDMRDDIRQLQKKFDDNADIPRMPSQEVAESFTQRSRKSSRQSVRSDSDNPGRDVDLEDTLALSNTLQSELQKIRYHPEDDKPEIAAKHIAVDGDTMITPEELLSPFNQISEEDKNSITADKSLTGVSDDDETLKRRSLEVNTANLGDDPEDPRDPDVNDRIFP